MFSTKIQSVGLSVVARHRSRNTPTYFGRIVAVFIVGMCAQVVSATEIPFAPYQLIDIETPANFLTVDLDHDGDLDIVATQMLDDRVYWLENTAGDGSSWLDHTLTSGLDSAIGVSVADLDGDGDLDIPVTASGYADKVVWFENDGVSPPTFSYHEVTTSFNSPRTIVAGDIDRDGDLDLAAVATSDDEISWFENDGATDPSFTKRVILWHYPDPAPLIADGPIDIVLDDIDADGDLDIVWGSFYDDRIGWLKNSGAATPSFSAHFISLGVAENPRDVSTADVDGDGTIDVLSSSGDGDVWAYRNTAGDGSVWDPVSVVAGAGDMFSVTASDIDRDGDNDLLTFSNGNDTLAWFENTAGDASAWLQRVVSATAQGAGDVEAADFDQDGDLDLIGAGSGASEPFAWWSNETIHRSTVFSARHVVSTLSGSGPNDVEIGDLDSDGDPDLVVSSFWDRTVRWYDNVLATSGTFTTRALYTAATSRYTEAVTLADLDSDGDLDAVSAYNDIVSGTSSDAIYWHENNDAKPPVFTPRSVTTVADGPVSLDTGDLDSDGDLDVVSGSIDDDTLRWYRNSGGSPPVFSPITMYENVYDPMTVWAEDLHHHGEVDILTATRGQDIVFWLWNDSAPTPSFWAYDATYAADGPRAVCTADINRDGNLDAVVAGQNNDGVWWLSNNFTSIWSAYPITGSLGGATAVAAHDLDRDGDVDIVAAGYDDDEIVWFDNGGTSPWDWTERLISSAHNGPRSVAVADLDRDGDLDLAAVSFADSEVAWFENRGGQAGISTVETAPGGVAPSGLDDVFRITVTHNGRAGDSAVKFSQLGLRFETAAGVPMTAPGAAALMNAIELYEDADQSGDFDPNSDALFYQYISMFLVDGSVALNLPDFVTRLRVDHGTPKTYFVVLDIKDDLASLGFSQFRVTHRTDPANGSGVSGAEDWNHDIVLDVEPASDVNSGWISLELGLFADDFETGDTSKWSVAVP